MSRVLVVEGDEHVGRDVRTILERAGHEVAVATDIADGVDLASTWAPDLVVLPAPLLRMWGDHDTGVAEPPTPPTLSVHDIGNHLAALMFGAHEAVELAAGGDREGADREVSRMQTLVQRVMADLRAEQASGHRLG